METSKRPRSPPRCRARRPPSPSLRRHRSSARLAGAARHEKESPAITLLVAREHERQPAWVRLAWSPESPELAEQPVDASSVPAALADAAWSVSARSRLPASALAASTNGLQLWTEGSGWRPLATGAPTRFAALVTALDGAIPVTWALWLAPDGSLKAHRAP